MNVELIKEVLRDYRYIEATGLGVPRKIIEGMRAHNGTEPDLTRRRVASWCACGSTAREFWRPDTRGRREASRPARGGRGYYRDFEARREKAS
jgi:hypothetical protein